MNGSLRTGATLGGVVTLVVAVAVPLLGAGAASPGTGSGEPTAMAGVTQVVARPDAADPARREEVPQGRWARYVELDGIEEDDLASVTLIEHDGLSNTGVLVTTDDGIAALLPVGGRLTVDPEHEIEEGVFESAVKIEGVLDFDADAGAEPAMHLTAAGAVDADPALARLDFHESIGLISEAAAAQVRCEWFATGCPDGNGESLPVVPTGPVGTLDDTPAVLAQFGDPQSSGTRINGNCVSAEAYGYWQYGCYDRYRGPKGTWASKSGQWIGEIARQSAGGRNTGYLFKSGTKVAYSGSGNITDWKPTATSAYNCTTVTFGGTRRNLSLSIPVKLCDNLALWKVSGKENHAGWSFAGGRRATRSSAMHTWAHKADGAADMGFGFWITRTYTNA